MANSDLKMRIWSGGFFDGEGCISIGSHGAGRYGLFVGITNSNSEVQDSFQQLWDGRLKTTKADFPWHQDKHRLMWTKRQEQLKFLRGILPYLILKKPQAELAIEFLLKVEEFIKLRPRGKGSSGGSYAMTIPEKEYRRQVYEKMKVLNNYQNLYWETKFKKEEN